jgi:hypothetical protein
MVFVDNRYVFYFTLHCPAQKLSLQEKKTLTSHRKCFLCRIKYSERTNGKKEGKAIPVTCHGGP